MTNVNLLELRSRRKKLEEKTRSLKEKQKKLEDNLVILKEKVQIAEEKASVKTLEALHYKLLKTMTKLETQKTELEFKLQKKHV